MRKRLYVFLVFPYEAGITVSRFPNAVERQWLRFCASPNPAASREPLLGFCSRSFIFQLRTAVLGPDSDNLQVDLDKHAFQKPVRKRKSDTFLTVDELKYENTAL